MQAVDYGVGDIGPLRGAVQNPAIGRDDDFRCAGKLLVDVPLQTDFPGPSVALCGFDHEIPKTSAIRHGGVKYPPYLRQVQGDQRFSEDLERLAGFFNLAVRTVDAGQVADAPVAAAQKHATRKDAFRRNQEVVPIDCHRPARKTVARYLPIPSLSQGRIGTGRAQHGPPLPGMELIMVADKF